MHTRTYFCLLHDTTIQIQERNSKSGKLHRAKIDPITGGITFTPGNRKTPIAYDRNRHTLIETTPEGDQIEVQLECDDDKENIDCSVDPLPNSKDRRPIRKTRVDSLTNDKSGTKRRRGDVHLTRSYADSTDPESSSSSSSSEDESDFEEPTNKGRKTTAERKLTKNKATAAVAKLVKGSGKRNTRSAKVSFNDTPHKKSFRTSKKGSSKNKLTEDDSDGGAYDPAPSEQSPAKFSSPIVNANWDDRPDWRCAGAIDY